MRFLYTIAMLSLIFVCIMSIGPIQQHVFAQTEENQTQTEAEQTTPPSNTYPHTMMGPGNMPQGEGYPHTMMESGNIPEQQSWLYPRIMMGSGMMEQGWLYPQAMMMPGMMPQGWLYPQAMMSSGNLRKLEAELNTMAQSLQRLADEAVQEDLSTERIQQVATEIQELAQRTRSMFEQNIPEQSPAFDPKTTGKMLQMRGEMMKSFGEILIKYGKEMIEEAE